MPYEGALAQDLEHELRDPEDAGVFADLIEGLPEIFRVLAERLPALAENLSEQAGPTVTKTVAALHDMGSAAQAGLTAAEQAALDFAEESAFWRGQ
jgi:hypothetical protein